MGREEYWARTVGRCTAASVRVLGLSVSRSIWELIPKLTVNRRTTTKKVESSSITRQKNEESEDVAKSLRKQNVLVKFRRRTQMISARCLSHQDNAMAALGRQRKRSQVT